MLFHASVVACVLAPDTANRSLHQLSSLLKHHFGGSSRSPSIITYFGADGRPHTPRGLYSPFLGLKYGQRIPHFMLFCSMPSLPPPLTGISFANAQRKWSPCIVGHKPCAETRPSISFLSAFAILALWRHLPGCYHLNRHIQTDNMSCASSPGVHKTGKV